MPGGAAFALFNLGVAIWTGLYIFAVDATAPAALFWANMAYFGIGLVPASWLVFAIRSAGRDWRITPRVLGAPLHRAPGDVAPGLDEPLAPGSFA